jgi:hypothetical protein
MLYHVAARLDIKWNVGEERRKTFALGALSVSNLPKECYLFKPTSNEPADNNAYQETIVDAFSPTTAWSGRKVVYVPQVKNKGSNSFPVHLHYTNAKDKAEGTKEFSFDYVDDVFTTWFNVEANFVNP